MIGKLQRKMSTKCFSESHARQKEMCFLKVPLADELLSAIIKVVKSPLPAHTWKMIGFACQPKPDWESDLSLRREGKRQGRCWGKAQHGLAHHIGWLLVLCCTPTPADTSVQGPTADAGLPEEQNCPMLHLGSPTLKLHCTAIFYIGENEFGNGARGFSHLFSPEMCSPDCIFPSAKLSNFTFGEPFTSEGSNTSDEFEHIH